MILFNPTPLVPKPLRNSFRVYRALLLLLFLGAGAFLAYRTLFPLQEFTLSFENPDSSRNSLDAPMHTDGSAVSKGNIPGDGTFLTYAGTIGSFSSVRIELVLDKDSARPESGFGVALRKSYRGFFAQEGEPIVALPKERVFTIGETPYLFSDGKLAPFISSRAALSYSPVDKILPASEDLLKIFPPEETYAGFRPGTLLSDEEGVYIIGDDREAHPIGSVDIFESLGFHWESVVAVSEEELRLHKRGKIFLFDAIHPDGTLFSDPETGRVFLIENKMKRLIGNDDYLGTLLSVSKPITVSEQALESPVSCSLERKTLAWRPTYFCEVPIENIRDFPGGSFEMAITAPETVRAATLSATFRTEPERGNASLFLGKIRERFKTTYGR